MDRAYRGCPLPTAPATGLPGPTGRHPGTATSSKATGPWSRCAISAAMRTVWRVTAPAATSADLGDLGA